MRDGESPFSDDYGTARDRFLAAADRLGVRAASIPGTDPSQTADIARLGSPEAPGVVILCNGGRGPGTLAGCGAALYALSRENVMSLPAEIGLILVHAANPTGPVWSPATPLSASENPKDADDDGWGDGLLAAAANRYKAYTGSEGQIAFSDLADRPLASMAEAAFDRALLSDAVTPLLARAQAITILDVRTGNGPFRKHLYHSCDPEGSAGRSRAERWLQAVPPPDEAEPEAFAPENCGAGLAGDSGRARRTRIILELGTDSMAGLLGGEGRPRDASGYPRSEDWRTDATNALRVGLSKIYANLMRDVTLRGA